MKKKIQTFIPKPLVYNEDATNMSFTITPNINSIFFQVDVNADKFSPYRNQNLILYPVNYEPSNGFLLQLIGDHPIIQISDKLGESFKYYHPVSINPQNKIFSVALVTEEKKLSLYLDGKNVISLFLPSNFKSEEHEQAFGEEFIIKNFSEFSEALDESQVLMLHEKYI